MIVISGMDKLPEDCDECPLSQLDFYSDEIYCPFYVKHEDCPLDEIDLVKELSSAKPKPHPCARCGRPIKAGGIVLCDKCWEETQEERRA